MIEEDNGFGTVLLHVDKIVCSSKTFFSGPNKSQNIVNVVFMTATYRYKNPHIHTIKHLQINVIQFKILSLSV